MMKDYRTFLKLQGAFGGKQTEAENCGFIETLGAVVHNALNTASIFDTI
jgi:hypothetical protein